MKSFWKLISAWWPDDPTEANYPAVPGGQIVVLGADGVMRFSDFAGAGEVLVEDGAMELIFDDDTGDVLYEG